MNPRETFVLGAQAYPTLEAVPGPIDLVNIFRKSGAVGAIVDTAIARQVKGIWMQEGVVDEAAATRAQQAGLIVVMDRCWLKEHQRCG